MARKIRVDRVMMIALLRASVVLYAQMLNNPRLTRATHERVSRAMHSNAHEADELERLNGR